MRNVFLMLLVLSLPATAKDVQPATSGTEQTPSPTTNAGEQTPQPSKPIKSKEVCNPQKATKMPETFY
jgi:hypothetical protein